MSDSANYQPTAFLRQVVSRDGTQMRLQQYWVPSYIYVRAHSERLGPGIGYGPTPPREGEWRDIPAIPSGA